LKINHTFTRPNNKKKKEKEREKIEEKLRKTKKQKKQPCLNRISQNQSNSYFTSFPFKDHK